MSNEIRAEIEVAQGATYELRWQTPDVPVINAFVDPDKDGNVGTTATSVRRQEFADPDPVPANTTASRVEIRAAYGPNTRHIKPSPFREIAKPPEVSFVEDAAGARLRRYTARFKARWPGVYRIDAEVVGAQGKPKKWVWTMTVVRTPRHYYTIQDVIDDPAAVRRQAIMASVFQRAPAFNFGTPSAASPAKDAAGNTPAGMKVEDDSGYLAQGKWVNKFGFPGKTNGTSCVVVNPWIMKKDRNDKTKEGGPPCNNDARHPTGGSALARDTRWALTRPGSRTKKAAFPA